MYIFGRKKNCLEKMPARINKIKLLVNETNGFENVAYLFQQVLFNKLENLVQVMTGSTKAQICCEMRDFVEFCKLSLFLPNMQWIWTCENMDAALEIYQWTAQSSIPAETQFN